MIKVVFQKHKPGLFDKTYETIEYNLSVTVSNNPSLF